MEFEWNDAKAWENEAKHGVSFEEAATVFLDADAVTFSDDLHSTAEARFITVGFAESGELLFVVYTERGTAFRIITARRATRREERQYERGDFDAD